MARTYIRDPGSELPMHQGRDVSQNVPTKRDIHVQWHQMIFHRFQNDNLGLNSVSFFFIPLLFLFCSHSHKDVDLANGLLEISKEAEIRLLGKNSDIPGCLRQIDDISSVLSNRIREDDSPAEIIDIINNFLFEEWQLIPEPEKSSIQNTCLTRILENRKGSCLGITGLYLAIAEGLNLPFYGVLLPGHIFIRYQDDSEKINVETLRKGIKRTDRFYQEKFMPSLNSKYYMRNLTKEEVIALFLFNLGNTYREREMFEDAKRKYKQALEKFPDLEEAKKNLQNIWMIR